MDNKKEGDEKNTYLENLIVLWTKWTWMVEIKHKDFIFVVPIMLR